MIKTTQKTVWILSELFYPEETGSGYFITRIAEAIAARHRVGVLTVQPTYQARGIKAPVEETFKGMFIHRCRATSLNKDILPFRLVNLLTISVSIFFNALFRIQKNDIVVVITNPPTLPFIASLICRLRRARLILRVEDLYPDVLIAAGLMNPDSVFSKMIQALHHNLYQRADHILVLGREMQRVVQSRNGTGDGHVSMIPHWADCNEIIPKSRNDNALLKRLGLSHKFVIQYSGNMGRTHDLESLITCARLLENEKDIHFLFAGNGAKEACLKKALRDTGLTNVTHIAPQPRAELTILLNACDLAVISFISGMAGASVPSRMYNILSAGKPILAACDKASELARVVAEEQVGWVVPPGSPQALADAIREAMADRPLLDQMSLRARQAATEKYACPVVIEKHQALMDRLVQSYVQAPP